MSLQSLTQAVAAMTPGPWKESRQAHWASIIEDREYAHAHAMATDHDASGIVAIRNNADALIECAALLREYYDEIGVPEHLADLDKRIISALARLEEIK
jgi:hypothetical protein